MNGPNVIVGGTFDVIHDGHWALLNTAFSEAVGGQVIIGITSDQMANESRERSVFSFDSRANSVSEVANTLSNIYGPSYTITEIEDPVSAALDDSRRIHKITVSPEDSVVERAQYINKHRQENGMNRLQIIEAPMVTDYEGRKISSTRIRSGEIDQHGRKI